MQIRKISPNMFQSICNSLKNNILSWYDIPKDIDPENLNIERIRYIPNWIKDGDYQERAVIVEFSTEEESYKELFALSELNLSMEEYDTLLNEQAKNGIECAKILILERSWDKYPVVWGKLDETLDNPEDYIENGKYAKNSYSFSSKGDE